MIISIILFVLLFITTIIVKLMQKNDTQGKLKRFNEIYNRTVSAEEKAREEKSGVYWIK